jgi:hypothetical protein
MYHEQAMTEGCASPPPPGVSPNRILPTSPREWLSGAPSSDDDKVSSFSHVKYQMMDKVQNPVIPRVPHWCQDCTVYAVDGTLELMKITSTIIPLVRRWTVHSGLGPWIYQFWIYTCQIYEDRKVWECLYGISYKVTSLCFMIRRCVSSAEPFRGSTCTLAHLHTCTLARLHRQCVIKANNNN